MVNVWRKVVEVMDIKKYYIAIKVAFLKIMKKQGKILWSNVKESTTQKIYISRLGNRSDSDKC